MEQSSTMDIQLVRVLHSLEKSEEQTRLLPRSEQLTSSQSKLKEEEKRLSKLETTQTELFHVNSQWDMEYHEQEVAFRRYHYASQQTHADNLELIAKLKAVKDELTEKIHTLGKRVPSVVGHQEAARLTAQKRVAQSEEEIALLRKQIRTYHEDFEAERRHRERIHDERQSSALRYEAEVTSLRLQLDRSRNELMRYTAESSRLVQQLSLKSQYKEDQFKKHLESRHREVMRGKQVSCFHSEKGCTWKGMFGQEYEEHLKECQFVTTLPEKVVVAIPDTPMVGVTQNGDKLVSFHVIEDDKLKKALSPQKDPQSKTKKGTPNKRIEPMERKGAKGIGPLTHRRPEMSYQQPEIDQQKPERDRQQPEMDHQQPERDRQQPEMDQQKPERDRQQPERDRQQPERNRQQPEMDRQQPEMECQQPEMDRQQAEMDCQQPERDRQPQEMDRQQPEMDQQKPEMDRQQPEMDQKPINMDKTHAAQLIVSLALGGMNKSSSQDIIPKEEAFLKLRELVRTYPEAMDLFLQRLKMKCDSMDGIREVSVGLVQNGQGEMHSTVMTESVLGPKDLSKVYKEIYEVRDEWYNIGLELNVPTEDLDHIKSAHPDNATCLREVLRMWLTRRAPGEDGPTWHSLTKALRSPTIGKSILADELQRKYCSPCLMGGEPDETSLSGLYDDLYAIREHWYNLGLKLGLTSATLDQIRQSSSSPKECLREVLRRWLQSDYVNRTPKTLCDALHSVTVGADQLAEELEKKYCLNSGVNEECDREEVMALLQELLTEQNHSIPTPSVQQYGSRKKSVDDTAMPPRSKGRLLSEDDLSEIRLALWDVRMKWYDIGIELGLHPATLSNIRSENPFNNDAGLTEMLTVWLKGIDPKPTWQALVEALWVKTVGEKRLANQIAMAT